MSRPSRKEYHYDMYRDGRHTMSGGFLGDRALVEEVARSMAERLPGTTFEIVERARPLDDLEWAEEILTRLVEWGGQDVADLVRDARSWLRECP